MKRFVGMILLISALAVPAVPMLHPASALAASDRKEVKERIELNNATAEQLVATGAVDMDLAKKIIKLRDELGGFQSYDDLKELNIPKETMEKLRFNTTIKGIASDCTC